MSVNVAADSLPNRFDFNSAEPRIYADWEQEGCFRSDPDPSRCPYTIVIPPPNVTGALHLGHALNNTLQDALIRFRRMQGYNALWMPGTDHAGIATQAVVERRLREEEGRTRHDLGREKLVARIWQWKEQYETRILTQLRQMGASCDWRRTRFTLDAQCARAVRRTFFDLFREHKIYRGKRLVNWDTFLQTAVSDDEVFHETVRGNFWHFRYPVIAPGPGEPTHVTIATTRPETMLGDTAVAVHPDPAGALVAAERDLRERIASAAEKDRPGLQSQLEALTERRVTHLATLERLRDMARAGRMLMLPLLDREIPLIVDEWAKPELGTGCVKITPAHDPNDYDVGLRHGLPMINILNRDGTLNANAGRYAELPILEARKRVVADLDQLGLLELVEDREIDLAHSDRSKTPIEPFLADQWFVRMQELSQLAMDAVRDGRVRIFPPRYARGYLDWLAEKRDWPVSRQLWWGHQIPVWSVRCQTEAELGEHLEQLARANASHLVEMAHQVEYPSDASLGYHAILQVCLPDGCEPLETHLETVGFEREADVLDTWFSSALWPHSTLGWPEKTSELEYYYPTSTLITSRDIITLWVARMVLAGLHNVGEVPFREVFIHPKILDGFGETMSKSKGNGVDPLDVIQKFGADALRFGLAYLTTDTQDVRMPVQFECPHCQTLLDQTRENRELPVIACTSCQKRFSTQWAAKPEDTALPRGAVVSDRFELARNFANKLWNAARFSLMGLDGYTSEPVEIDELPLEDRWLLSRLATVTETVTAGLEGYRYAEAARSLYDFAWDEFCSLYIEITKERFRDSQTRPVAQRILAHALDQLLRLLHPFMPFLTEEIWQRLNGIAPGRGVSHPVPAEPWLIRAAWPLAHAEQQNRTIESQFAHFQSTLGAIREIRSRQGLPPKQEIQFSVRCEREIVQLLEPMRPYFKSMAKASVTAWGPEITPPPVNAQIPTPDGIVYVDLGGIIDVKAEIDRNEKQLAKLAQAIQAKQAKLANAGFVDRAPTEIVARERESLAELQSQRDAVEKVLAGLRLS